MEVSVLMLTPCKGEKCESYRGNPDICPKSDGDCTGSRITAEALHCRDIYFWKPDNIGFGVFQPFGINPVAKNARNVSNTKSECKTLLNPCF
jgi:hypothetical protein